MGFVFYDTETSGTNTKFDQILQFAAIQTDEYLNIIEKFEIRSRLLPHVVPHPKALQVTGISIDQLLLQSTPSHYEMVAEIKRKLDKWSSSIFLGYNSIRFDEELLRQAFYQNLYPPYLTNTNGNCRNDLMHLVKMVAEFAPGCLQVPVSIDGKRNFKLDQLAPLNGFSHEHAHDALSDVEATIYICKLISQSAPDIWSRFLRFSQKAAVEDFIQEDEPFILSEFYFGNAKHIPVIPVGKDGQDKNTTICFNLLHNLDDFRNLTDTQLADKIQTSATGLGKPVRKVKANAGPNITSFDDTPEHIYDTTELEQFALKAEELRDDESIKLRIVGAYEDNKTPYETSPHIEEQIYSGFALKNDSALMNQFHALPWEKRIGICDYFEDPRYAFLAKRLIYFNTPHHLNETLRNEFANHVLSRLRDGEYLDAKWTTLQAAKVACEGILAAEGITGNEILYRYLEFLTLKLKEI
ncbi:MAG: hypothetical protein J0L55_10195 [Caulobacterales bacterium]|nr:hypothetical protein [Caulobacterales bacterium]